MSINKKLVSAALTATTILWAVGAAALPLANAQTTSSAALQAQITSLLQEIATLQAQLGTSSTATTGTSYNFTSDLTIGSKGAAVSALQQILINGGYLTVVSAPTGYFGTGTQAALAKYLHGMPDGLVGDAVLLREGALGRPRPSRPGWQQTARPCSS